MEQLIERSKTILGEIQMQVMSLESKRFEQAEHVQDLGRKYVDQVNEFAKAHGIDTSTSPRTRNHRFDEAM